MKEFVSRLLFGKDTLFNGLVALGIIGAIALGCTCPKDLGNSGTSNSSNSTSTSNTSSSSPSKPDASTGEVPTEPQLQEIARTTILDFNDAIQKGDFTDFHKTMSKPFQKQASPTKLKDVFKAFVDAKLDFKEVRTLDASFSPAPEVESGTGGKVLRLKGNYPTKPRRTNFELKYIPEGKDWKLISIEIYTKD